jgi:branched-chain amino acid transport system permease protein
MSETRSLRQRVFANKPRLLLAGILVYMLFMPSLTTSYYLSIFILANVFAIYAVAWDFLSGLTGYLNFGPSFFVGAGAYGLAILFLQHDIALFLAIPAAFLIAILAGLMVAIPALRLRGFYFVLITLLLPLLALKFTTIFSGITGGNLGLRGLPRLSTNEVYYGSLLLLLVVFSVTYWLSENDFGLVLRGIRANELAVESAGISTTRFKIGAFVISSFFMAAGGIFYGFYLGTVLPSTTFDLHVSIEIILSALLGGLGTIYGPIGGAYFFIFARELLLPLGSLRFVILFALSGVILYVLPNGLTPFIWNRVVALLGGNDE